MHEITYEQMLIQLRSNFHEKSALIADARERLEDAINAKDGATKSGCSAEIRTHESHKRLISKILGTAEILMLSAGD